MDELHIVVHIGLSPELLLESVEEKLEPTIGRCCLEGLN